MGINFIKYVHGDFQVHLETSQYVTERDTITNTEYVHIKIPLCATTYGLEHRFAHSSYLSASKGTLSDKRRIQCPNTQTLSLVQ